MADTTEKLIFKFYFHKFKQSHTATITTLSDGALWLYRVYIFFSQHQEELNKQAKGINERENGIIYTKSNFFLHNMGEQTSKQLFIVSMFGKDFYMLYS